MRRLPSADRDWPRADILLVGDPGPLRTLRDAGYEPVLTASDGLTGALSAARWDLVVVGRSCEGLDAPAICRQVRAEPSCLDVPVIVQASISHGDRPAVALEAGADDYVIVPWEPVELLTRVRLALAARRVSGTESRWHAMVANLPGAVYRCELDDDWTMRYISDRVLELTGYPSRDFVDSAARTFASIIHPDDQARVTHEVGAAVGRDEPFISYYRIVRADGEVRHVVDRGRLVDGRHARRWLDGFIADVTAQQRAEARLRETLAGQATAEERARIARDLHDSVSQSLFSMTLHARAAQLALQRDGGDEDGRAHRSVAELRELTQTALAEMRALIFELRPDALADEGIVSALRKHAAAVAAREGIPISVDAPDCVELAAEVEEALYRLAQEAIHNVVKHAQASAVTLSVTPAGGHVHVEIRDDGVGFDPDADHPGHLGLLTMRERVGRVGGRVQISSGAGLGTCVHVEAPARGPG